MQASAIHTASATGVRQTSRWIYLLVALVAILPYLGLPSKPMVYDAPATVLRNEAVQSGPLSDLLAVDFWGYPLDSEYGTRSYRPLVSLTYALEARTFDNSPAVMHVTDMALHILAAVLVAFLAESLGLRRLWAAATGALFAVHPVQTEAVSSIVGRADIMAAVCLFGALVLHLQAEKASRPWLLDTGSLVLVAVTFFCKEYAVAFPFIVIGVDLARWWSSGRRPARGGPFALAVLALLAAYLLLRHAMIGSLGGVPMLVAGDHPLVDAPWGVRLGMALRLFALAGRLLLLPYDLNHHYRQGTFDIVEGPFAPLALVGMVLTLGSLLLGVGWARRRRDPLPIVAWLLLVLPLLPALNLVSLAGVLFAERYMYIPVAGLALLLAAVFDRCCLTRRSRRAGLIAVAGVLTVATGLTTQRVSDWGSDERLARSSIEAYPGGSEVWRDLGLAVGSQGRHQEAADAFERSLEITPEAPQTWQAYATALFNLGRFTESAEAWRRCVELMPEDEALEALYVQALVRSAEALLERGDIEQSLELWRRAADLDPELPRQMHEAALRLEQVQRYDEAAAMFREILFLRPDHAPSMFNLGRVLILADRPEQATRWLRAGLAIRPDPRAEALLEQALAAAENPE